MILNSVGVSNILEEDQVDMSNDVGDFHPILKIENT